MNYKHSLIRVFQQDFDKIDSMGGKRGFVCDWNLPRKHTLSYSSLKEGEKADEEAFHILNAPLDILSPYQREIVRDHRSHSLSVGDVVEVEGVEYLCCSHGWEKKA
jgi:hypothetical protein